MLKENYTKSPNDYRSLTVGRPLPQGSAVKAIKQTLRGAAWQGSSRMPRLCSTSQRQCLWDYSQLSKQLSCPLEMAVSLLQAGDITKGLQGLLQQTAIRQ